MRGRPSYPVVWREGEGLQHTGKLELADSSIVLEGSEASGVLARVSLSYRDLAEVRIGRSQEDRIGSRPSLVLERRVGEPIRIGDIAGLGSIVDIGHVLAELLGQEGTSVTQAAVIVPIRKGKRDRAHELIQDGAPFDPEESSLECHRIYLTEREAIFVFEGPDVRRFLEELVRTPEAWRAATAWKDVIAGRPRLAEEEYSWARRPRFRR